MEVGLPWRSRQNFPAHPNALVDMGPSSRDPSGLLGDGAFQQVIKVKWHHHGAALGAPMLEG